MAKSEQAALFITDAEAINRVKAEQARRKDKTAARTATKILLEYFLMREREGNDPDKPRRGRERQVV